MFNDVNADVDQAITDDGNDNLLHVDELIARMC